MFKLFKGGSKAAAKRGNDKSGATHKKASAAAPQSDGKAEVGSGPAGSKATLDLFPAMGNPDKLGIEIDEEAYLTLLGKLIGESERLQNFPPELVPREDLAVAHVMEILEPFSTSSGGPLEIETFSFVEGRSNVIIRYAGAGPDCPTVSLIGSHLDVVPAQPENWERDPFTLQRDGDKLYGRGTTDCLGHIALVTLFFEQLALKKPELTANVVGVFIASEEATDKPLTGIDGLEKAGHLEQLKNGVCLWIDASDSEPCMGTAGALQWHLTATGKRFHSGLPHLAINPIELVNEALKEIQTAFYNEFPAHIEEERYKFTTCSTIKPTQMKCSKGGLNQIPLTATVSGDVRLTPFYSCATVAKWLEAKVDELNKTKFAGLENRGPVSKYELPKEGLVGKLELEWGNADIEGMSGIACNIDSPYFLGLCESFKSIRGSVRPYSVNGSLPLVYQMQEAGFNLLITGFGRSEAYHAVNEFCVLSEMLDAARILSLFVSKADDHLAASMTQAE